MPGTLAQPCGKYLMPACEKPVQVGMEDRWSRGSQLSDELWQRCRKIPSRYTWHWSTWDSKTASFVHESGNAVGAL